MPLSYLALGDSYTIGEAVPAEQSFPFQLVEILRAAGMRINDPRIIATTGWTTDELLQGIKAENITIEFDLVTLLIGVNNQYRGYSKGNYRNEFIELVRTALTFAGNKTECVYVVSIPDWGVTPFAQKGSRNVSRISAEIAAFNKINEEEALKAGVSYVDITPGSKEAAADRSLLASDGLHPSAKMYAEWAEKLKTEIGRKEGFLSLSQ
jgi:lysophospholipase L1-like esterase